MSTWPGYVERRTDWLLRQFVRDIEARLRIGDLDEFVAGCMMRERLVPQHVQDRIIRQAGWVTT